MDIKTIAREIMINRIEKGFHTPQEIDSSPSKTEMLAKLCLVHSEVSEAAEAVRKGDFENFSEEIADIIIRILDIAATTGMNLEAEIMNKMFTNKNRPFRHGKKCDV